MGGGSSGGTDINQSPGGFRFWGDDKRGEQKDIGKGYGFQFDQFNNYVEQNPLLNAAQSGALSFWDQLPSMLNQFSGFQKELGGYQNQLGGYQNQLGKLGNQLGGQISGIKGQTGKQMQQLQKMYGTLGGWLGAPGGPSSIIASQGALTPGLARDVSQQTRGIAAAQGQAHSTGALGQELLNRDAYRQQRYNTALQQGQGLLGQQQGVTGQESALTQMANQLMAGIRGQEAGVIGQQGGLAGLGAQLTGQKAGLLGQQQGLQTGGLNQLLGAGNAAVSQFGGLTNPILSYMQGIFGGNQQAAIQQAQINAQKDAAGGAKAGGAMQGAGSIIGAVIPMLAALSDKRIKTKIKDTGLKTEDKIPIKTFEYKTRPGVPFIGVMAQDVEKKVPEAVITDPLSGLKMVDFWKVAVPMAQLKGGKL